jgi:hypothetical protein
MDWVELVVTEYAPRLRELSMRLDAGDAQAGHAMGCVALEVRAQHTQHGRRILHRVASAALVSKTKLYAWALVAQDWPRREFDGLMRKRGPLGTRLHPSHVLLLAGLRPRELQRQLVERVLDEHWTVEQLRQRIPRRRKTTAQDVEHGSS